MKKTIIALMALAGMATATEQSLTLATKGNGNAGGASGCGLSFILTNTPSRYTITAEDESLTLPTTFQFELSTISFAGIQTASKSNTPGGDANSTIVASTLNYYLYITDKDCNVLGLSTTAINIPKSATDAEYTISGTSGQPLTLSSGTEYRAYFVHKDRVDEAISATGVLTPAEANGLLSDSSMLNNVNTSVSSSQWGILNANGVVTSGYVYDVTITGKLVPEPTTATLSLLALAGLAARRRRR